MRNFLAKAPRSNFPKRGEDGASQRERGGGRESRAKKARALKRSYVLSGSAVMRSRTRTSPLSAHDPLSGQEKWRRLTEGRFGFITL